MIFDTRVCNCYFKRPPKTRLPTPAALSGVECAEGQELYVAGGDIDTCFYRILAPKRAKSLFTLPPVKVKHLRALGHPCCKGYLDHDSVTPQLNVLPMDWSWSLWIAQCLHEDVGRECGQLAADHIVDRAPSQSLSINNVLHAKYVDNFIELGHDPATVALEANSLTAALNDKHLKVHEMFGPTSDATFVGLRFDGRRRQLRIGTRRLWKVRFAIDSLFARGSASGSVLESLIGHITWAMLVRRESLSILDASYEFCNCYPDTDAPLGIVLFASSN